jgi:hypothetical protein
LDGEIAEGIQEGKQGRDKEEQKTKYSRMGSKPTNRSRYKLSNKGRFTRII